MRFLTSFRSPEVSGGIAIFQLGPTGIGDCHPPATSGRAYSIERVVRVKPHRSTSR